MELAIVKMIMRVEEEFEIVIDDEEASLLETVGQLHACVLSQLDLSDANRVFYEEQVWRKLKEILVDELSVESAEVTPHAQFVRDLRLD